MENIPEKKVYKKWWFWIVIFLVLVVIDVSTDEKSESVSNQLPTQQELITETISVPESEVVEQQDVPTEYKSALNKANAYANTMHMSKRKIYDQLVSSYGEAFTEEAAKYALENVTADWNANALKKARDYQNMMNMSPVKIREQLVSDYGEKFSSEEADYAIANLE